MLDFWNWREIRVCIGTAEYAKARDRLAAAGIEYRWKTASNEAVPPFRSRARNMLGRMGNNAGNTD